MQKNRNRHPENRDAFSIISIKDYLISTSAPASSKEDLRPSASSLETPSFKVAGAPSTKSFASFNPAPVNSFTSLTTASLEAPAALRITVNSVCASAVSPPAAAPPAATATAAAAGSIPYSSFKIVASSFTSLTVRSVSYTHLTLPTTPYV